MCARASTRLLLSRLYILKTMVEKSKISFASLKICNVKIGVYIVYTKYTCRTVRQARVRTCECYRRSPNLPDTPSGLTRNFPRNFRWQRNIASLYKLCQSVGYTLVRGRYTISRTANFRVCSTIASSR